MVTILVCVGSYKLLSYLLHFVLLDTSLDMELWTCRTHLKPGEVRDAMTLLCVPVEYMLYD